MILFLIWGRNIFRHFIGGLAVHVFVFGISILNPCQHGLSSFPLYCRLFCRYQTACLPIHLPRPKTRCLSISRRPTTVRSICSSVKTSSCTETQRGGRKVVVVVVVVPLFCDCFVREEKLLVPVTRIWSSRT